LRVIPAKAGIQGSRSVACPDPRFRGGDKQEKRNENEGESSTSAPLAVFEHRQAAPTPVLGFALLDDDEGRVEGLVEDVEQELAGAGDELGLLLWRDGAAAGAGALARDLDGDHRHGSLPSVAGALAAVDMENLTRHEASCFQIQDGVDDV